jgi:hypothetical protein
VTVGELRASTADATLPDPDALGVVAVTLLTSATSLASSLMRATPSRPVSAVYVLPVTALVLGSRSWNETVAPAAGCPAMV